MLLQMTSFEATPLALGVNARTTAGARHRVADRTLQVPELALLQAGWLGTFLVTIQYQ